jgi:hypothetical protein
MSNPDEKAVVEEDKQRLAELDEEINQTRQHLKQQTGEDGPTFIEEGSESRGETDDTIVPPG